MPVAVSPAVSMLMILVIFNGRASRNPGNWTSILNPDDGINRAKANANKTVDVSKPMRFESGIKRSWSFINKHCTCLKGECQAMSIW